MLIQFIFFTILSAATMLYGEVRALCTTSLYYSLSTKLEYEYFQAVVKAL